VPPKFAVDKLHAAGIPIMNMIGAVKHATINRSWMRHHLCSRGRGRWPHRRHSHLNLLPKVVDVCRGHKSPLTGGPVLVVGAGGIFDGRGLAMALTAGCSGVWVGTRFIATDEAGAGPMHKQAVVKANYDCSMRTTIYSGRPMRIFKTPYTEEFETKRADEIVEMSNFGMPAFVKDLKNIDGIDSSSVGVGIFHLAEVRTRKEIEEGLELTTRQERERGVYLTGQCAGAIEDIKPARAVVDEMVAEACVQLQSAASFVSKL